MDTNATPDIQTRTIHIGGMTCANCQRRIEEKLRAIAGIEDAAVSYTHNTARVRWNPALTSPRDIHAAIETLGYTVHGKHPAPPYTSIAGTLILILALYTLLRALGAGTLGAAFPLAEAGMSYGMIFITGLVTSLHCLAMCGGINLSQTVKGGKAPLAPAPLEPAVPAAASATPLPGGFAPKPPFDASLLRPSILYNAGRVISYTTAGTLAGALGAAVSVSGRFQGAVQLAAGIFMVIMGINMLGICPALRRLTPRLPKAAARRIDRQRAGGKSPLVIGLLNGLMPCGPLQAMQLYALSTGSPLAGGLALFLFSAGTVPLMFGLGTLSALLSVRFTRAVTKAGALLITAMGLTLLTYGWNLAGLTIDIAGKAAALNPFAARAARPAAGNADFTPVIENGVQIVNSTLSGGSYPAITVRQGIPVKWTITAPAGSINGCNNRAIIREYGIEHRFQPGGNVIEFTPAKAGIFPYSCWMGMIRGSITVLAEGERGPAAPEASRAPVPAGVSIPTDAIAFARLTGAAQTATIRLKDDGIEPAIMVVQRGLPARWVIANDSLDPGNSRLIIPAYYTQLDIAPGETAIQFLPAADFEFSTGDAIFYGYVKVVNDINTVDIEALKAEVASFETLIYPESYFEEAAAASCSCCGGPAP